MENARHNNFDFLRFALASLVIFSHSFDLLGLKPHNPFMVATRGQIEGGTLAVYGFFIISGYLIAQSYLQSRGTGRYLLKRVLRIYPAYVATAAVCLLFFSPLGMHFSAAYWSYVEPGRLLIRLPALETYWIPHTFTHNHWPYINAPVWTIKYEFLCYLLVPLAGVIGVLRRRWWVLALFLGCYTWHLLNIYWHVWVYNWQELPIAGTPEYYPRFLTYFLAGTVCLAFSGQFRISPRATFVAGAAAVAVLIGAALSGTLLEAVLPFALPVLIFTVAFARWLPLQHWARFGDFSYGLYLYGWPVQQSVILFTAAWASPWSVFALALPLALLLAIGSWYAVERPFLSLKSRLGRRTPRPVDDAAEASSRRADPRASGESLAAAGQAKTTTICP